MIFLISHSFFLPLKKGIAQKKSHCMKKEWETAIEIAYIFFFQIRLRETASILSALITKEHNVHSKFQYKEGKWVKSDWEIKECLKGYTM